MAAAADDRTRTADAGCRYQGRLVLPVTVTITCTTARDGPGRDHPVTINPDWSIDTGHDLAAERLAAALGGYLSCLELADQTIPALRRWLCGQHRCHLPPLRSGTGRSWTVLPALGCCRTVQYQEPEAAADHARSIRHLALETGARRDQLEQITDQLALLPPPVDPRDDRLLRLWRCGIRPETAAEWEAAVGDGHPLPVDLHLAMLARRPDPCRLRELLGCVPRDDAESAWIAWNVREWDRVDRGAALRLLALPIPARLALALADAGCAADAVTDLAAAHGASHTWAARQWAAWADNGFAPTTAELIDVFASEAGPAARSPSPVAVSLAQRTHPALARLSPTQAALAIARHASAAVAARELAAGGRTR